MKKIKLEYLTKSEEELIKLADTDIKSGIEIIGDCLVEFFDLISQNPKCTSESYISKILDSRKKIDLILNYVSKRIDVSLLSNSYKDLLNEYCTPKKSENNKNSNHKEPHRKKHTNKPVSHHNSTWPPLEEEYSGHYVHLRDCGMDIQNWLINNSINDGIY